tara:strand:- start:146 stop:313 length:168 start_codon:yes stop_codon:yes gene_type:complete
MPNDFEIRPTTSRSSRGAVYKVGINDVKNLSNEEDDRLKPALLNAVSRIENKIKK